MNILFVYADILEGRNWPGYFFVGIGSLSAVLKQNGHQTSLFHITGPIEKRSYLSRIEAESPDLIAFSPTSGVIPAAASTGTFTTFLTCSTILR